MTADDRDRHERRDQMGCSGGRYPDRGGNRYSAYLLTRGLIAPKLMAVEFADVMWKKVRRGEMMIRQAEEAQAILPTIVSLLPDYGYLARAFETAILLDHPVYDCLYVAVAEIQQAILVTADKRLLSRCVGTRFQSIIFELAARNWP